MSTSDVTVRPLSAKIGPLENFLLYRFMQYASSPSSPAEQCCVSPEDKAVLIALTIGQHNVTELSHHRPSTLVHQLQRSEVIWLLKAMLV